MKMAPRQVAEFYLMMLALGFIRELLAPQCFLEGFSSQALYVSYPSL
jgi:hypothetical protein